MLTALFLRNNDAHIVSFRMLNGNYRTICGKVITKSDKANTLAADNTFPVGCSICRKFYDEMYQIDLTNATAESRGPTVARLKNTLEQHEFRLIGDHHKYANMDHRFWPKLNKYEKKIPTGKEKRKKRYE